MVLLLPSRLPLMPLRLPHRLGAERTAAAHFWLSLLPCCSRFWR